MVSVVVIMKTYSAFFLLSVFSFASAQKSAVYQDSHGAIKGYDPVAYFVEGSAKKGMEAHSFEWSGVTWYFSSEQHLEKFKTHPEWYAPQFGGYCSYAVSQGYTYKSDPEAWKIVDGKLYLNYSLKIKKKWEANQAELIRSAEANWPKVIED